MKIFEIFFSKKLFNILNRMRYLSKEMKIFIKTNLNAIKLFSCVFKNNT